MNKRIPVAVMAGMAAIALSVLSVGSPRKAECRTRLNRARRTASQPSTMAAARARRTARAKARSAAPSDLCA
jgi:hypothetical protein